MIIFGFILRENYNPIFIIISCFDRMNDVPAVYIYIYISIVSQRVVYGLLMNIFLNENNFCKYRIVCPSILQISNY